MFSGLEVVAWWRRGPVMLCSALPQLPELGALGVSLCGLHVSFSSDGGMVNLIPDGCSGPLGFMGRFGPQAIQGPVAALGLLVRMAGSQPLPAAGAETSRSCSLFR